MTEERTNAFQDSQNTIHDPDLYTRRELPISHDRAVPMATMDAGSGVPKPRDPLLSTWKELACLYCKDVEFILEDLEQLSGCELWLSRLNEVKEQFRESVYTRLRTHIEGLLHNHIEKLTPPVTAPPEAGDSDGIPHPPDSKSIPINTSSVATSQTKAVPPVQETSAVIESTVEPTEPDRTPVPPAVFKLTDDWWDGHGRIPNAFVRSAMFTAVRTSSRRLQSEAVASLSNIEIRVTGPQLTQPDLDVWMIAVWLARNDGVVRVNRRAFLENLDRSTGSSDRDWLINSLKRQHACYIEVSLNGQPRFTGHLLKSLKFQQRPQKPFDPNVREIELELDPSIITLFHDGSTNIKFSARSELRSDPLANWLLGFYASHGEPYAIKVDTIQKLCGASGSVGTFRRRLTDALLALEEGRYFGSARIVTGKVLVDRAVQPIDHEREPESEKESQTRRRKAHQSQKPLHNRNQRKKRSERTLRQRFVRMWCRIRMIFQTVSRHR